MPVLVLQVGRPLRQRDGVEREQRGDRVDAGVRRLRDDAEAAAGQPDSQLGGTEQQRGREREERGAPRGGHGRS